MADTVTTSNILVGQAKLSIASIYVAGVAGAEPTGQSFVDVGATMGGTTLDRKAKYHDIEVDQHLGMLDSIKTGDTYEIKVTLAESTLVNIAIALDAPTAAVSGANLLHTPDSARVLRAVKLVGVGPTSTFIRTILFWRCVIKDCGPIAFKRDSEQLYQLTIQVLQDLSVFNASTAQDFKITDS